MRGITWCPLAFSPSADLAAPCPPTLCCSRASWSSSASSSCSEGGLDTSASSARTHASRSTSSSPRSGRGQSLSRRSGPSGRQPRGRRPGRPPPRCRTGPGICDAGGFTGRTWPVSLESATHLYRLPTSVPIRASQRPFWCLVTPLETKTPRSHSRAERTRRGFAWTYR